MGRAKLKMEYIANKKNRKKTYSERLKTLKKSIYEFSELCGVDACMIVYDPDQGKPEICPRNMNEVQRITKRYLQIPKEKRDKLILDDKKKEKTREYDEMPMSRQVNGFSIKQLEQLHSKLGSKIETLSEKIQSMDGGGAGMSNEAPQKEYPCYNPERASDHEPTVRTNGFVIPNLHGLCFDLYTHCPLLVFSFE
ncbi:agamous-like MADS-box protein AGL36 [Papaver somniferum]|uniref:agamous-like MADS-box protein AGL36 n=1 Tax=Papaver somniferum TaxID=3469 RepID=UPI000E6FB791|nr:agamous-like MADS-box protein AGL36 [Papaver somniferum]